MKKRFRMEKIKLFTNTDIYVVSKINGNALGGRLMMAREFTIP